MSKQDRQAVRTAVGLERKYKFGKSFAKAFGIAEDARKAAEEANENLNSKMTPEEIFNLLTDNGTVQGIYRENGQIYINAAYIVALAELFAKDLTMTGKFINSVEVFLEPGLEEWETIYNHILGNAVIDSSRIALYDFNNDGVVNISDMAICRAAMLGKTSVAEWSGAVKSLVTITIDLSEPVKAICITGTNMWGRTMEHYIGVEGANIGTMLGDVNVRGRLSVGGAVAFGTDTDDNATMTIGATGTPRKLSWKDNGDGTYSLIGE